MGGITVCIKRDEVSPSNASLNRMQSCEGCWEIQAVYEKHSLFQALLNNILSHSDWKLILLLVIRESCHFVARIIK